MNFFRKIKSIVPTYQKHGLDSLIYAILKKPKIKQQKIKDLDDDEKWLIVSKGRKQTMNWLVFTPKDSQNVQAQFQ